MYACYVYNEGVGVFVLNVCVSVLCCCVVCWYRLYVCMLDATVHSVGWVFEIKKMIRCSGRSGQRSSLR